MDAYLTRVLEQDLSLLWTFVKITGIRCRFGLACFSYLVVGYGDEARFIMQPAIEHFLELMSAIGFGYNFIHA